MPRRKPQRDNLNGRCRRCGAKITTPNCVACAARRAMASVDLRRISLREDEELKLGLSPEEQARMFEVILKRVDEQEGE